MNDLPPLGPRVSAQPWALYRADALDAARRAHTSQGFYEGMLREDLSHTHYAYEPEVKFRGVDPKEGRSLLNSLLVDFSHDGYERDPKHLIFSLADVLLDESLHSDGVCVEPYSIPADELVERQGWRSRSRSDPSADSTTAALGYLPGWSIRWSGETLTQISPTPDAPRITIPSSRLRQISVSPQLRRRWKKVVERLAEADEAKVIGDIDRFNWAGYDFARHAKTQELLVAACTTAIGWDARGLFSKYVTGHYLVYRRLKFVAFWRQLVDEVVASLNEATSDAAILGSSTFAVSLSGLPDIGQLESAMAAIRSGSTTIAGVNDRVLMPRYASRRQTN